MSDKVSAKVSNWAAQIELKFQALLPLKGGELSQFTDIEPSLLALTLDRRIQVGAKFTGYC